MVLSEGAHCPGCSSIHEEDGMMCANCKGSYPEESLNNIMGKILKKSMPLYTGNNPRQDTGNEQGAFTSHGSKPELHLQSLYDANRGIDSGSRSSGSSYLTTGSTLKPRLKKFMGIRNPGSII
jgi:hypothetical protein